MPTQLSFDHHYIYDDNDDGIILPTILNILVFDVISSDASDGCGFYEWR